MQITACTSFSTATSSEGGRIAGTEIDYLWPTSPDEAKAYRDAEEKRLLPIMKAAGIKPE
jgi:hypothetical protein